jgi:hypothetical protein
MRFAQIRLRWLDVLIEGRLTIVNRWRRGRIVHGVGSKAGFHATSWSITRDWWCNRRLDPAIDSHTWRGSGSDGWLDAHIEARPLFELDCMDQRLQSAPLVVDRFGILDVLLAQTSFECLTRRLIDPCP